MFFQIPRCYDSHIHLLATGMMSEGLRLFDLKKAEDIASVIPKASHFRGDWLVGFGWDQHKWPGQMLPTKSVLDKYFPDYPVAFSRADGHAVWLNSKALQLSGYLDKTEYEKETPKGGVIIRDEHGFPTGIFIDNAKLAIDMIIPPFVTLQKKNFLYSAIREFNSNGFTHVRDMSGFEDQYSLLCQIDDDKDLSLYVDLNFTCEDISDFERALRFCIFAQKQNSKHIHISGIKFYFDGALGSEGAYLSQNYAGSDSHGFTLWDLKDVEEVFKKTWENNLEVSVHTIGDQAADLIASTALKVQQQGFRGKINFEHAEILRPETVKKIAMLDSVCHMQPCHWLSDRIWLKDKLGSLYQYVFPWRSLQEHNVQIQWGSDSPIERPSVLDNIRALRESSSAGIPEFKGDFLPNFSHPRMNWGGDCKTKFKDGKIESILFDGNEMLKV